MNVDNSILYIENLVFKWKRKENFYLKINRLEIKKNSKVILLGESGSGKSTLLNLVSGIIEPNNGKIIINGTSLTTLSSKRKDIFRSENLGVIFQKFNILEYLSPIMNILLPSYFCSYAKKKSDYFTERAIKLGEKLGLSKELLFQNNSRDLSVGQVQRVAIVRALINSPKIILADEPTSALDSKNKEKFLDLLFSICVQEKISILMVSHDHLIKKYFDEVLLIDDINKKG